MAWDRKMRMYFTQISEDLTASLEVSASNANLGDKFAQMIQKLSKSLIDGNFEALSENCDAYDDKIFLSIGLHETVSVAEKHPIYMLLGIIDRGFAITPQFEMVEKVGRRAGVPVSAETM